MTTAKFSEQLRQFGEPYWSKATDHVFIREMVKGELSIAAFRHYLIQDYAFFRHFTDLISQMIVHAPEMGQIHHLAGFLSHVTDGENDYFLRSFAELGVSEKEYLNPTLNPVMQRFADTIEQAIKGGYHDCLMVLLCAEWVYWSWGDKYREYNPQAFYFAEWQQLHNNADFGKFVSWLQHEADRLDGPDSRIDGAEQTRLKEIFRHCCQLEEDFFTYAYAQGQ